MASSNQELEGLDTVLPSDLWRLTLFGYLSFENRASRAYVQQNSVLVAYSQAYKVALHELLQHTAKRELKEVERIVGFNPSLILAKGNFREEWCGQRSWTKGISPLEYTAWAGDTYLLKLFLQCLTQNAEKTTALEQMQIVYHQGTEHGPHLSAVTNLVEKYRPYARSAGSWHWPPEERKRYWIHEIGKAQLRSVVSLLEFYCGPTPFAPLPCFTQSEQLSLLLPGGAPLDLSRVTVLGLSYALYKGAEESVLHCEAVSAAYAMLDCEALERFCVLRKHDLQQQMEALSAVLQVPLAVEQEEKQQQRCLIL